MNTGINYTAEEIKELSFDRKFRDCRKNINSMDFSKNGDKLVTGSDGDNITIYDCESLEKIYTTGSKKYGVTHTKFTRNVENLIYGSNKVNDNIRYLNIEKKSYIRYFIGHEAEVTSISMSPVQDIFLSGSADKTVRLWDLQSSRCEATMNAPCEGIPVAAFDPEGIIFAVGYNSSIIKLYDMSSFSRGPFETFHLPYLDPADFWTDLKFGPNGGKILLTTVGGRMIVVDAFTGNILQNLNTQGNGCKACFSSDGDFLFCGANENSVGVWSADAGQLITQLQVPSDRGVNGVAFNPKNLMLAASSGNNVNMFLHSDLVEK